MLNEAKAMKIDWRKKQKHTLSEPLIGYAEGSNTYPEDAGKVDIEERSVETGSRKPEPSQIGRPLSKSHATGADEVGGPACGTTDTCGRRMKEATQQSQKTKQEEPPEDSTDTAPATNIYTLGSSRAEEVLTSGGSVPNAHFQPQEQSFKRRFHMAIHLAEDRIKNRVCCLDTGSDWNIISEKAVKECALQKERWEGGPVQPLGESFTPQWQVTFDWHVSGKNKTYQSIFLVFDEKYSPAFDVLLGHETIDQIQFYRVNSDVWWFAKTEEDQEPVQMTL